MKRFFKKSVSGEQDTIEGPVFEMIVEVNPLYSEADYGLMVRVMPLEVVYNTGVLDAVGVYSREIDSTKKNSNKKRIAVNFFRKHILSILLLFYYSCIFLTGCFSAAFFGNAPTNALEDLESAARSQYESLKNKTTLKIQYELQSHKTIEIDLNISVRYLM